MGIVVFEPTEVIRSEPSTGLRTWLADLLCRLELRIRPKTRYTRLMLYPDGREVVLEEHVRW